MLVLGHIGLTTCSIRTFSKYNRNTNINYIAVIIGSILPDIIDKGLSIILYNSIGEKVTVSHSPIFSISLIISGLFFLTKHKNNNLLLLGICSLIHLFLDSIRYTFNSYLFPLFSPLNKVLYTIISKNFRFIPEDIIRYFLTPEVLLAEIFGAIYLSILVFRLIAKHYTDPNYSWISK